MFRRLSLISLACLIPLGALAQRNPNFPARATPCELQIHVSYEDDRPAERLLQVELLNSNGGSSGQAFTDDRGYAVFQATAGNYRVRVSGPNIIESTSSYFSVNERELTHMEYINVRRTPSNAPTGPGGTVAVADLNVPDAAAKEFKKANELMEKNDLVEARKHFDKAIKIYPSYASAYFGEGVLEYKSGDKQKAREDFEKTITLNDHFVLAYFNLATMAMKENDYKRANELLSKANTADPVNPQGLLLTAQVDLLLKNYDGAVECARRLHAMQQHQAFAIVHYIAARAYLYKQKLDEAAAEYKHFLEEAPTDSRVPKVREELAALTNSQTPQASPITQPQRPAAAQAPADTPEPPEPQKPE